MITLEFYYSIFNTGNQKGKQAEIFVFNNEFKKVIHEYV